MDDVVIPSFVFVDFENVPAVDLQLLGERPVQVTLLIGKHQKKLDLALVQQVLRLAPRVQLVEVGATGHNALDLTLGYYLGRAVVQAPQGRFFIVSKDKDFEPLIAHLKANGIDVSRHDAFTALPFLPRAKKSHPGKAASPAHVPAPVDRLEKLIARLKNATAARPKKKASLLARINTDFGNKLDEPACDLKLEELIARGVVSIDGQDKVTYP
jgi:hypothetical protein